MKRSFDIDKYVRLLRPVASLSHLFSDNDIPYVSPKFVERLYVLSSGARDTAGDNSSFDAIAPGLVGVGVKTFVASKSARHKYEKIAEFTADANAGVFDGMDSMSLLRKAIELRNERLSSDAASYGIDMADAIYHCLIRVEGAAMVHEELMSLVREVDLHPVDSDGRPIDAPGEKILMSDGRNVYTYNKSKRVLYKRFPVSPTTSKDFGGLIHLPINRDILQGILERGSFDFSVQDSGSFSKLTAISKEPELITKEEIMDSFVAESSASYDITSEIDDAEEPMQIKHPTDFVILPLYSTRSGSRHEVPGRSGINQWNAGGRVRAFGEAYIPVPRWIHRVFPGFFPGRDQPFRLKLQDGTLVNAKLCQDESKALMSDPNDELCRWLYRTLEPTKTYEQIKKRLPEERPYTYADLRRVGKDCVKVTKVFGKSHKFELSFCGIGDYEKFEKVAN